MKAVSNEELKIILADLLDNVDRYCKKYGIQYFLDSGTLLGAVRHKGFIPWDDDIDICMKREEYDKFIALTQKEKIADHISVSKPEDSLFPYIKINDTRTMMIEYPDTLRSEINVYIDVFPKDGHPDNEKAAKRHCKRAEFYCYCYWFNKYSVRVWKNSGNIIKKVAAYIMAPFVQDSTLPLKKAIKIARKYSYSSARYTSSILAGGIRGRVPTDCFASAVDVEFEGKKYPAPIGYDVYLKALYKNINNGDYMQLPPEDKRAVHETEVYWKDGFEMENL